MRRLLSDVGLSNLYTKGVAAKNDLRQAVPAGYAMPNVTTRVFLNRLIIEEALEACEGFGVTLVYTDHLGHKHQIKDMANIEIVPTHEPDLDKAIDACGDTVYVATGAMVACGAPDLPHLREICRANDAKFPGGVAITNEYGKYQKPEGWVAPDHAAVRARVMERFDRKLETIPLSNLVIETDRLLRQRSTCGTQENGIRSTDHQPNMP